MTRKRHGNERTRLQVVFGVIVFVDHVAVDGQVEPDEAQVPVAGVAGVRLADPDAPTTAYGRVHQIHCPLPVHGLVHPVQVGDKGPLDLVDVLVLGVRPDRDVGLDLDEASGVAQGQRGLVALPGVVARGDRVLAGPDDHHERAAGDQPLHPPARPEHGGDHRAGRGHGVGSLRLGDDPDLVRAVDRHGDFSPLARGAPVWLR